MKTLLAIFTSFICFLFTEVNAQCTLDMSITIDGSGNIVTTNNSTGVQPGSHYWYVYNMDMNPWQPEHTSQGNTLNYAPLYIGNYMVCLVGTEIGTNNACDSLCTDLNYTQSMMLLQENVGINDLKHNGEISIYPVPAEELLHITGGDFLQTEEFVAYDMMGKAFAVEMTIDGNTAVVDVRALGRGMYVLKYRNTTTLKETTVRFAIK